MKADGIKASKEILLTQPYVLTAGELSKLYDSLEQLSLKPKLEIQCADGIEREFSGLGDLLNFENPPNKDIQRLRIRARSEDLKTYVSIKLDNSRWHNIALSVEGREEDVIQMSEQVDERLAAMRPWYSFWARFDMSWLPGILFATFFAGVALATYIRRGDQPAPKSPNYSFGDWSLIILLGLTPTILGFLLNRVRRGTFPMGVFAIGQGEKRHTDKEVLRTVVFVGFIISFLSSIVATLLFMLFS